MSLIRNFYKAQVCQDAHLPPRPATPWTLLPSYSSELQVCLLQNEKALFLTVHTQTTWGTLCTRLMKFANLETSLSVLLCFLTFRCSVRSWMDSRALQPACVWWHLPFYLLFGDNSDRCACQRHETTSVHHPEWWRCVDHLCSWTGVKPSPLSLQLWCCIGTCLEYIYFPVSSSVLEWYVQAKGSHLSPSLNVNSCFFHSILPGLLLYTNWAS